MLLLFGILTVKLLESECSGNCHDFGVMEMDRCWVLILKFYREEMSEFWDLTNVGIVTRVNCIIHFQRDKIKVKWKVKGNGRRSVSFFCWCHKMTWQKQLGGEGICPGSQLNVQSFMARWLGWQEQDTAEQISSAIRKQTEGKYRHLFNSLSACKVQDPRQEMAAPTRTGSSCLTSVLWIVLTRMPRGLSPTWPLSSRQC